ncbi:MAG: hypothetical protein HOB37_03130, partial [Rhodospirillaceae bacterium]|nr:hypothetical protein [Rhodospirillaceae bacterium]
MSSDSNEQEDVAEAADKEAAPKVDVTAHSTGTMIVPLARIVGFSVVALTMVFVFNNYLNFWLDWPGVPMLFADLGVFGTDALAKPMESGAATQAWLQFGLY